MCGNGGAVGIHWPMAACRQAGSSGGVVSPAPGCAAVHRAMGECGASSSGSHFTQGREGNEMSRILTHIEACGRRSRCGFVVRSGLWKETAWAGLRHTASFLCGPG